MGAWLAGHGGVVALGGLLQIVAGAYLGWALPRLAPRAALGFTAAAALALLLGAAFALRASNASLATAALLGASSLLAGHLGWWLATARAPRRGAAAAPASDGEAASQPAGGAPTTRPDRTMLGRYRIERQLGRGAMGAVYLGLDPQIGRRVAIKTLALAREFGGSELAEARARFFREAETAGRLQHPDIVTIFDAGEDQDLAYIAMEYVRGHDLLPHTRPGHLLPLPEVLDTVARVAEALAYAHRQGVVHRDIKPANVMIDASTGSVKVTDFGIARITDHSRTRTGLVLGTPSFMSPEHMAGGRIDGRSDLYSLGVMLFQLLTGALPHASESMAELMNQIANQPAPDVRHFRPELPEALGHVVALALEKRPEMRYADGRQMALDLRAVARSAAPAPGPKPAPGAAEAHAPGGFEATARFSRSDPRHNSGL